MQLGLCMAGGSAARTSGGSLPLRWRSRAQRRLRAGRDTWNPTFEAARELVALGHQGRFEIWRPNGAYPCVRGDLVTAAALTVREDSDPPPIVKYEPNPADDG